MRILVLGGTGFIGAWLIEKLYQAKHQITVITRKQRTSTNHISYIQLNRKDRPNLIRFLERLVHYDVIYDLAAYHAQHIDLIIEKISSTTRYIFISSAAVYGPIDSLKISEETIHTPLGSHMYGHNKWGAEQKLIHSQKNNWVIVRPSVVYGPRDSHPIRGSYWFEKMLAQEPFIIPGRLEIYNNYIYVEDLVDLLYTCIDFPPKTLVNAGSEMFNWLDYLRCLEEIVKMRLPHYEILGLSLPEFTVWERLHRSQFPHNAFHNFVVSIQKAQSLGWKPNHTLAQGLKKTWLWWQTQRGK